MADPTYTIIVRVPIPRGDFVDPPQINWDSGKDEALWKILSGAAQPEIDWHHVAERFNVPVDFLLQQVAYITERHASQVRAQVRKATAAARVGSSAPSPVPGSDSAAGFRSLRRNSLTAKTGGSGTGTPLNASTRPIVSRTASTNTTVFRDGGSSSPRPGKGAVPTRPTEQSGRRRLSSLPITSAEPATANPPSPGPAESDSTMTSEDESSPAQSRIIRRPPRFQQDAGTDYADDEEDEEESEPAFQPYRPAPSQNQTSAQDLTSTLRGDGRDKPKRAPKNVGKKPVHHSQTSDSDAGSGAASHGLGSSKPGPLSPRRTAELSGRSPGSKYSRDGSDGTPSMGSSFSDLDDASVTQSALEEALASHMNRGAGSRFSISSAFRSRYTPNSSNQ